MRLINVILLNVLVIIITGSCQVVAATSGDGDSPASIIFISDGQNDKLPSLIDRVTDHRDLDRPGVVVVSLSQSMLNNISVDVQDTTWNDILKRINNLQVYVDESYPELFQDINKFKASGDYDYEELMRIKKEGNEVKILVHRYDDQITELLLIYIDGDKGGMISLKGNLTEADLRTLRKGMEMEAMEGLPGMN